MMKAAHGVKAQAKSPPHRSAIDWPAMITHVAFMLALAAAVSRCLMMESLRETFPIALGHWVRGRRRRWRLTCFVVCRRCWC